MLGTEGLQGTRGAGIEVPHNKSSKKQKAAKGFGCCTGKPKVQPKQK